MFLRCRRTNVAQQTDRQQAVLVLLFQRIQVQLLVHGFIIASVEPHFGASKGKGKAEHLYSALYGIQTTLKRSGMDHTVLPATNTMPALPCKRSTDGASTD